MKIENNGPYSMGTAELSRAVKILHLATEIQDWHLVSYGRGIVDGWRTEYLNHKWAPASEAVTRGERVMGDDE